MVDLYLRMQFIAESGFRGINSLVLYGLVYCTVFLKNKFIHAMALHTGHLKKQNRRNFA